MSMLFTRTWASLIHVDLKHRRIAISTLTNKNMDVVAQFLMLDIIM